jgi:hypothetical protein
MKRGTWVLVIALVALVAILLWWVRKKAAASPTGTVSIGPVTVTDWNPPPAPTTFKTAAEATVGGGAVYVPPSPVGTISYTPPIKGGLGINGFLL